MYHDKTANAAKGKWKGILMHFGLSDRQLNGKHGPCPVCDGTDRFRYDNIDGKGTSICSHCGARDGMGLVMAMTGRAFPDVAKEVDGLLGNIKHGSDEPKQIMTEEDQRRMLRTAYQNTAPIRVGDLAHRYLASRKLDEQVYPGALRFAEAMRDGEGGIRPAMVAMVSVNGAKPFVTMHRTFLRPDGSGKADMTSPRKLMAGSLPDGACVALSEWRQGQVLGIAEGIETALSAANMFGIPVWAAINATMMTKWFPPEGCEDVVIFGDNDASHTGHAAAFTLSRKLRAKKIRTTVRLPDVEGEDWADVYMREG